MSHFWTLDSAEVIVIFPNEIKVLPWWNAVEYRVTQVASYDLPNNGRRAFFIVDDYARYLNEVHGRGAVYNAVANIFYDEVVFMLKDYDLYRLTRQ